MLPLPALLALLLAGGAYVGLAFLFGAFYFHHWQLPIIIVRAVWSIGRALALYVFRGCKPRFPEWTLPFELTHAMLRELLLHYGDRVSLPANAPIIRRQSEQFGDILASFAHPKHRTRTQSFQLNGLEQLWVRSATTQSAPTSTSPLASPQHRVVVMYIHGGGHAIFSPRLYQALTSELQQGIHRALCEQLGLSDSSIQVDVLLANYRKAPEHPYPSGPLDALAMYKFLLEEEKLRPQQIIVIGDSAGGGLTMTTMLRLRDEDPSLLPLAGILSCPFVDRETKGDERATPFCFLTDRFILGFHEAYYQGEETPASWGDASPYHCDLRGLPPVYVQAGELDYILPHAKRLFAKAQASGLNTWSIEIFPNMPHVFTLMPSEILPMATNGIDAMAQFAATQFATALRKNGGL